jgi:hypothetical protein
MKRKLFLTFILGICFGAVLVTVMFDRNKKTSYESTDSTKAGNTESMASTTDSTKDEPADTDDYAEESSVYSNPIDRCLMPIIYSEKEEISEVEIRAAQDSYKELWRKEFENLMKVLRNKCTYSKDEKNIDRLKKRIQSEIESEIEVVTTELLGAYKINPNPKEGDDISRMSLWGNGTRSRLNQIEGEIYRDASMRIINVYGFSGEEYEFRKSDYSVK